MDVRRVSENVFEVESESEKGRTYYVWFDPFRRAWHCSCPGFAIRLKTCKHILLVLNMLKDGGLSLDQGGAHAG